MPAPEERSLGSYVAYGWQKGNGVIPLVLHLSLMLVVILVACELFTNALEHLGERLGISEGATGSIFAAVGTALPETTVPLLAVLAGTSNLSLNEEIGVGAILGAPLMLSTLSTALMALSVLRARKFAGRVRPEITGFTRDLNFFMVAFMLSAVAMFVPPEAKYVRGAFSVSLVTIYFFYVLLTVRASRELVEEGHGTEAEERLFLSRAGLSVNYLSIGVQMAAGLALLVSGAKGFINSVEGVSELLGISPLLLSLIVVPVATELPEKINSILWVRAGKDTMAFGNITGAMVFQSTLLPALGIMLTPWQPRIEVLTGVTVTLCSAAWLWWKRDPDGMPVWVLLANGVMYILFLAITLR